MSYYVRQSALRSSNPKCLRRNSILSALFFGLCSAWLIPIRTFAVWTKARLLLACVAVSVHARIARTSMPDTVFLILTMRALFNQFLNSESKGAFVQNQTLLCRHEVLCKATDRGFDCGLRITGFRSLFETYRYRVRKA